MFSNGGKQEDETRHEKDWSSLKLQGAAHLSGGERCCGIKDAGYKGEWLEGKRRKRRTDMMECSR